MRHDALGDPDARFMAHTLIRPNLLYAWKGTSLLVVDTSGECAEEVGLCGFYHREARFLRTFRLQIDGRGPWLCEAASVEPELLLFTYTYPEVAQYGGGGSGQSGDEVPTDERGLPQRGLDVRLTYRVGVAHLDVTAAIGNRTRQPLDFEVSWVVDADFVDIQEAQVGHSKPRAEVLRHGNADTLELQHAHEQLAYRTSIRLPPIGNWRATGSRIVSRLRLEAGETREFVLRVDAQDPDVLLTEDEIGERDDHLRRWRDTFTRIETPGNAVFDEMLRANVRDAASFPLLEGARDEWLTLQAGVPLYPAFFGRDAVTAGWQMGCVDCGLALDAALTRLGRLQSRRDDEWHDEEPGRIPYQVRIGPLARLNLNPYAAYYADYASPLMFVISLANLYAWTGDDTRLRRHWDTAQRILEWARERGDLDGDGYLEYQTRSRQGTKNQGWKDSGDAIVYEDGSPVPSPIATCELQGYWYAAQQLMGALSWMTGSHGDARAHWASAAALKARFNRDWWLEEDGFFALAMDPDKRLVRAASSNVGHCLSTGIIDREHIPPVVARLFAPDMFSGWGIRTLSSAHEYYNPLSYHRGTVWAVEQATMLFGLRRFGFDTQAHDLARALFDLARLYPEYRIPECVGGYSRGEQPTPGAYPQANAPQLWNATAFPLIVQTLAGMLPLARYNVLIVDPSLPDWLPTIVLHDLRVGEASVTLRFWRDADGASHFEVMRKRGNLRIVRQPPPESLSAGVLERLGDLVETYGGSAF